MTWPRCQPMIYTTWGEHTNLYSDILFLHTKHIYTYDNDPPCKIQLHFHSCFSDKCFSTTYKPWINYLFYIYITMKLYTNYYCWSWAKDFFLIFTPYLSLPNVKYICSLISFVQVWIRYLFRFCSTWTNSSPTED